MKEECVGTQITSSTVSKSSYHVCKSLLEKDCPFDYTRTAVK